MSTTSLPKGFENLLPFTERWAIADELERLRCRETAPADEMRRFYDAVTPLLEQAAEHLGQYRVEDLAPAGTLLYRMLLSYMDVGFLLERVHASHRERNFPLSKLEFDGLGRFDGKGRLHGIRY